MIRRLAMAVVMTGALAGTGAAQQSITASATILERVEAGAVEVEVRGAGSRLVELAPEEIQASGDHEILNWIVALGIIGDTAAEIVDVRESPTQLAFRVVAIWE